MSQKKKLFDGIRNNPKDVAFSDACKAAELLKFTHTARGGTSHRAYSRTGCPIGLNFQDRQGKIKPYQARQLIAMMDLYEDEL